MLDLFKSIPSAAYVALITALLTASVTLLATYLANRGSTARLVLQLNHERSLDRERIHRERGEELYVLSERYFTSLVCQYLPYLQVMRGELTYNEALDLTGAGSKNGFPEFARVEMLVDVWFPGLSRALQKVFSLRDEANRILAEHKAAYKRGEADGRGYVQPMVSVLNQLPQATAEFRRELVAVIRAA